VVTVARARTVERLMATGPAVKRWGGVVLVALGVWFIALGVFAGTFARVFPVTPAR
jgi:hypothetical protein